MTVNISIDAMGGDFGPNVTMEAVSRILTKHSDVRALVFGDRSVLLTAIDKKLNSNFRSRLDICHCDSQVDCDDKPSTAVRSKQHSSMALALQSVKDGEAQACISAGNTGVLMALSLFTLGTLPGISRPAICAEIPTDQGNKLMLDLGANVDCSPQQLYQFAVLGSYTATLALDIPNPSLRLLNVGSEAGKGNNLVQATAEMLERDDTLNYQGFIEGDGIFQGHTDVIVCDGFSGNVALKAGEGVARYIYQKLSTLPAVQQQAVADLTPSIQPSLFNGAYVLGVNGVVLKSHGGADAQGFANALDRAINAARHQLPSALLPELKKQLKSTSE
jgi:glycerol-3-phosphate acyltransferase PlsX